MEAPHGYYTAKEAVEKLGIPRSTFFVKVGRGLLQRYKFPGYSQAFYSKQEVDNLAAEYANQRDRFKEK